MNHKELIKQFLGKRVLVIGDIMLDKYIWGSVSRISPEAPVQIVDVSKESYAVGGAGNTSANITSLGGEAHLISVAGEDSTWNHLSAELIKRRVPISGVIKDAKRRTTRKVRVIGGTQQLIRFDYEIRDAISSEVEKGLLERCNEVIDNVDIVIVSDYAKGIITQSLFDSVALLCKDKNKLLIVDPKPSNAISYKGASLITPNAKEARELLNDYMSSIEDVGKKLAVQYSCNILLTRGEKGMLIYDGSEEHSISTHAKEVFDVSGAGDTVVAATCLGLACGASLYGAAVVANHAAGVVVAKLGTSCLTLKELEESFND